MSESVYMFVRLRMAQLSARSEGLEAVRVRPEAPSVRGRDRERGRERERDQTTSASSAGVYKVALTRLGGSRALRRAQRD